MTDPNTTFDINNLVQEYDLTPEESDLLETTYKNLEILKANTKLADLLRAWGFACGGIKC